MKKLIHIYIKEKIEMKSQNVKNEYLDCKSSKIITNMQQVMFLVQCSV